MDTLPKHHGARVAVTSAIPNDLAPLRARGARLLRFPSISEQSGTLVWGEVGAHLPFVPQRFWFVGNVPRHGVRGDHAHRTLQEVLLCASGSCTVTLDDGNNRDEAVLDSRDLGLYIPALTWNTLSCFSEDAVVLVFASEVYQPDDYIRDYDEFLALVAHGA
jgi:UDP-2-acetamido-3-amino-2,3-dideoxy-glucuronate N-acetyltransferase